MAADWQTLAQLRRRGVRPVGGVWIVEDAGQRASLAARGFFAAPVPCPEQCYLAAGLDVLLLAARGPETVEVAHAIAAAHPASFVTAWHGDKWREVVRCRAS